MICPQNRRILLADDMLAIHADFRKILVPQAPERADLGAVERVLQIEAKALRQLKHPRLEMLRAFV
jgi:hypothetical protein